VTLDWQVIVAPSSELPSYLGRTLGYCAIARELGSPAKVVVLNGRSPGGVLLAGTMAHELFHLFQSAQASPDEEGDWWTEATAEWGRNWLLQPHLPLTGASGPGERRWRFVQFLASHLGDQFWPVLNESFASLGLPERSPGAVTAVVSKALSDHGFDLGHELGHFWGEHLTEHSLESIGETPPFEEDPTVGVGSHDVRVSAPLLAANFGRIRLADDVGKATITISPGPEHGQLWTRLGSDPPADSSDPSRQTLEFCVRGSDPDAQRWPGSLSFAYTNGGGFGPTETGVVISVKASADPCEDSRHKTCHSAPRLLTSPLLDLAGKCPPKTPEPPEGTGGHGSACGAGGVARGGVYDTDTAEESMIPDVYLTVLCNPRPFIYVFGGTGSCPYFSSSIPVPYSITGGYQVETSPGPGTIRGGSFDFSYPYATAYGTSTIHVSGAITPSQVTGEVSATNTQCSPSTYTEQFSASYRPGE
jgi:hypothetical protein